MVDDGTVALEDATKDQLVDELFKRATTATYVDTKPEKIGDDTLAGIAWKGTKIETLGLLCYGLIRVGRQIVEGQPPEDHEIP